MCQAGLRIKLRSNESDQTSKCRCAKRFSFFLLARHKNFRASTGRDFTTKLIFFSELEKQGRRTVVARKKQGKTVGNAYVSFVFTRGIDGT